MENNLILKRIAAIAPIFSALVAAVVLSVGCKNGTNPLIGWKCVGSMPLATLSSLRGWTNSTITAPLGELPAPPLSKAISDDYQDFVQKLPVRKDPFGFGDRSERYFIEGVSVFEDGTGQRAILINIPLDGTYWNYVLIYNKSDVRTKMIKFSGGHYSC
jgi:hypothetical protein